jgi:hypothetical protein
MRKAIEHGHLIYSSLECESKIRNAMINHGFEFVPNEVPEGLREVHLQHLMSFSKYIIYFKTPLHNEPPAMASYY